MPKWYTYTLMCVHMCIYVYMVSSNSVFVIVEILLSCFTSIYCFCLQRLTSQFDALRLEKESLVKDQESALQAKTDSLQLLINEEKAKAAAERDKVFHFNYYYLI